MQSSKSTQDGDHLIIQHNNDPKYTATANKEPFRVKRWDILDWLSQLPDLSLTEQLSMEEDYRLNAETPQQTIAKSWESFTGGKYTQ